MIMKRRTFVRTISYSAALCCILAGFALGCYYKMEKYQLAAQNSYLSSFSQLVSGMSNLNSSLKKSIYASSPSAFAVSAADIWREASSAKSLLGTLPLSGNALDKTSKFISQSGEYAYFLLKKASSGEKLSDSDRENIRQLSNSSEAIVKELSVLKTELNEGHLTLSDIQAMFEAETPEQPISIAVDSHLENPTEYASSGISNLQGNFPEYASLIYDGPYSDHIEALESSFLEGKREYSNAELLNIASVLFHVSPEQIYCSNGNQRKIKTTYFSYFNDDCVLEAELTNSGGYVLNYTNSRSVSVSAISTEEAIRKSKEALEQIGFFDMRESYYSIYNHMITINFAYTDHEITCYPDLIKVSVALDNGEILSIESYGYLMNHKVRSYPASHVTSQEAAQNIHANLTILSQSLAVIPTDGHNELICYEIKAISPENVHYIIYVNIETGMEENIFILIEDENGVLAI